MQTITFDNAASNGIAICELANNIFQDSFIEINKDLFHNHCFAHILNIIVKDELKGISEVIKKWKCNKDWFPTLFVMAQDFLSIPATSIASEQAFSCAGRIIDESHTLLDSDT
ncbi:7299_t:CDS:2, partial [Cetraspora pellucida]